MDGILLFDKPLHWTSHDAVDFLRRRLKQKKIGHAGTLDPLATGLLVMLLGAATKHSEALMGLDKDYRGSIRLGVVTETWDLEGKVLSQRPISHITRHEVQNAVAQMNGTITITPPSFSALKKEGRRYYALAREGTLLEPPKREVVLKEFRVEDFTNPEVFFFVSCSKGTYVRSLAHHLGEKLGCGACLSSLVRTRIGDFYLEKALNETQLKELSIEEIDRWTQKTA